MVASYHLAVFVSTVVFRFPTFLMDFLGLEMWGFFFFVNLQMLRFILRILIINEDNNVGEWFLCSVILTVE